MFTGTASSAMFAMGRSARRDRPRARSPPAIYDELFLSIKTVEPIVSAIFANLDLQPDAGSNRRVLAVLAYLRLQDRASVELGTT
jgi:hypothetical protein